MKFFAVIIVIIILSSLAYANSPPVISEFDDEWTIEEGEPFNLIIYATDADGDELAFSALDMPRGSAFIGREFSWRPDFDQDGSYRIRFVVSDGMASDTKTLNIRVLNVNNPPKIIGVSPSTSVVVKMQEGAEKSFGINAVDPDGDKLTYEWLLDGRRKKRSQSPEFRWEPDFDEAGFHVIKVIVSDKDYKFSKTWNVSAEDQNRRPMLKNMRDRNAKEGERLKFRLSANDPDDDPLVFRAEKMPQGAGLSPDGEFTWTPDFGQEGIYRIDFIVTDGDMSHRQTMKIFVAKSQKLEQIAQAGGIVDYSSPFNAQPADSLTRRSSFVSSYAGSTYDLDDNVIYSGTQLESGDDFAGDSGLATAAVLVFIIPVLFAVIVKK